MKIVDIIESTRPIKSDIRNAYIDFSKMTLSLVAVVTDVIRDGKPRTVTEPAVWVSTPVFDGAHWDEVEQSGPEGTIEHLFVSGLSELKGMKGLEGRERRRTTH